MSKDPRFNIVYSAKLTTYEVLESHGYTRKGVGKDWRIPSPVQNNSKKNSLSIKDEYSFKDFYNDVMGDAVQLDYYLTYGEELQKEKGVDTKYFRHKAKMLNVDLDAPISQKYAKEIRMQIQKDREEQLRKIKELHSSDDVELNHKKIINRILRAFFAYSRRNLPNKHVIRFLKKRGMTNEEIIKSPFIPALDSKEKSIELVDALKQLGYQDKHLIGTPGFYMDDEDQVTMKYFKDKVISIPVFDIKKRLLSFQLRATHGSSRYWSLSSAGMKQGCSPGAPIGFWGNNEGEKTLIITEGGLKGYLIHTWLDIPVMYLLGVNSQYFLPNALKAAKEKGFENVLIAFDMDYQTNDAVKKSLRKLMYLIKEAGLKQKMLKWNSEFKGLDDFLLQIKKDNEMDKLKEQVERFARQAKIEPEEI